MVETVFSFSGKIETMKMYKKLLLNEIVQKREKEIKSGFLVPSPR